MISQHIRRYTSPNENEYGYPHSNALLQFLLKLEHCKPHNTAYHPIKCDVINDVKLLQIFDVINSEDAVQKQMH